MYRISYNIAVLIAVFINTIILACLDRGSDSPADVLQESPIGVLTPEECEAWYEDMIDVLPLWPDHICIDSQGPDGVHACHVSKVTHSDWFRESRGCRKLI